MTEPSPTPPSRTPFPERDYAAFLFDMDGTLLTSITAVERVWGRWADRHGLQLADFLPTLHGVRALDTVRRLVPDGVDHEAEADWITRAEIEDTEGVAAIPGIVEFLRGLPDGRWAIVTSASPELMRSRLAAAGLAHAPTIVNANDVEHGKPAPDCFLLAADRLGVPIEHCLVFEDAPAGITAAERSGATVVMVTATHAHPVETPHATIADYRALSWRLTPQGLLHPSRAD